jgi:hypothetical protein
MQRQELEGLSREQLIALAERLGIPRPRVLTQSELVDEIIGRTAKNEREKAKARGWLGRARDLLARVVERGLHLPEAARVLRSSPEERAWPSPPPPLATVTLAEIYAAQGHLDRAINVLNEVLARDPDHQEAQALRARFNEQSRARTRGPRIATGEASAAPSSKPAAVATPAPAAPEPGAETAKPPASLDRRDEEGKAEARIAKTEETEKPDARGAAARESTAAPAAAAAAPKAEAALGAPSAAPKVEEDAAVLEDATLPERYDVDEIVAIAVDPLTLYLYWEVRARTLARAQARHPDGWLGVRVVSVIANWSGPVIRIQDMRIDALYGDRFVRGLEPGSNVRVSVGWKSSGDFEPFAVGVEVTVPHLTPMTSVAEAMAVWEPQQSRPVEPRRLITFNVPRLAPHASPEPNAGRSPLPRPSRKAPSEAPVDHGVAVWTESVPVRTESTSTATESRPWFTESAPSFSESISESFTTFLDSFTTFTESFTTFTESFTTLTEEVTEQTEVVEVFDVFEWGESTVSYIGAWLRPVGASELARGIGGSQLVRRGGSQLVRRGASQLVRRGASELMRRSQSKLVRQGASELVRRGASELVRRGASDLSRRGGSELSRGGGSELPRKLR